MIYCIVRRFFKVKRLAKGIIIVFLLHLPLVFGIFDNISIEVLRSYEIFITGLILMYGYYLLKQYLEVVSIFGKILAIRGKQRDLERYQYIHYQLSISFPFLSLSDEEIEKILSKLNILDLYPIVYYGIDKFYDSGFTFLIGGFYGFTIVFLFYS